MLTQLQNGAENGLVLDEEQQQYGVQARGRGSENYPISYRY